MQTPAVENEMSVFEELRRGYAHASARCRREFMLLVILMLVGAVGELATIGSLIPFLELLTKRSGRVPSPWPAEIIQLPGARFGHEQRGLGRHSVSLFAVFAGAIRLELSWLTQNFTNQLSHELAVENQRRVLFQPIISISTRVRTRF